MDIQYASIIRWPGRLRTPAERTAAPFKAKHTDTLKMLERELRLIAAEGAVVQLALGVGQFTSDGRPYYRAAPEHPGVVVSFSKPVRLAGEPRPRKVPLTYPADKFRSWEANLRAVAIGLEDLRRIDRYGITSTGEQYLGFKALPGPVNQMPTMTPHEAAAFVIAAARPRVGKIDDGRIRARAKAATPADVLRDEPLARALYRQAAAELHPDNQPDAGKWAMLAEAMKLIDMTLAPGGSAAAGAIITGAGRAGA